VALHANIFGKVNVNELGFGKKIIWNASNVSYVGFFNEFFM
jgi:hypothetical protein